MRCLDADGGHKWLGSGNMIIDYNGDSLHDGHEYSLTENEPPASVAFEKSLAATILPTSEIESSTQADALPVRPPNMV